MRISSFTKALIAGVVSFAAAVSFAAPSAPDADKAIPKVGKAASRIVPKQVPVRTEVAREDQRSGASNGVNQDAGVSSVGSHAPRQV